MAARTPATSAPSYCDPSDAAISPDEHWCVVVGEHIAVRGLDPTAVASMGLPDTHTTWYYRDHRTAEMIGWFDNVTALGGPRFRVTSLPEKRSGVVRDFLLDADRPHRIQLEREWTTPPGRQRERLLAAFTRLPVTAVSLDSGQFQLHFGAHHALTFDPSHLVHLFPTRDILVEALTAGIGRRSCELRTRADGSLDFGYLRLRIPGGAPAGAWTVSDGANTVSAPGPQGWTSAAAHLHVL